MRKIIVSLLCLLLIGCSPVPSEKEIELTRYVNQTYGSEYFDTAVVMQTYAENKDQADELFEKVCEKMKYYTSLFDKYNDYEGLNNIKTINDYAGIKPVEVDSELIELLLLAKEFSEMTDGAFDITIGNLLNIWHEYREEGLLQNYGGQLGAVPTAEELENALQYRGYEHMIIDEENSTVYLDDPNISIDVGGIAKGYSAQKISDYLNENYPYAVLLSVGESNIQLLHTKPDNSSWKVGVRNPDDASDQNGITVLEATDTASIVTSGDYQRYYVGEDKNIYHHIVDPNTGYPAKNVRSVAILCDDGGIGDILSTALMIMGAEKGMEFIEEYNKTHTPVSALWIYDEDTHPDLEGEVIKGFYVIRSK